jgi:hypothetical protein
MRRALRNAVLSCLVFGTLCAMPARAFDPVTMILFGIAREIMYEAFENSLKPRAPSQEPLPQVYPGTMVEPRKLREQIDESFFYLSERRRAEIFQAFHEELIKPKNALVRASMIQYFSERAYAVRSAIDRLSKLTEPEMRAVTAQFATQVLEMKPEDRKQLRKVLDEGLLPVPPDLNRMLVAAVRDIPQTQAEQVAETPQEAAKAKPKTQVQAEARASAGRPVAFGALSVMPGAQPGAAQQGPAPGAAASPEARAAGAPVVRQGPRPDI